jgi:branched-chain amino acid aminotransferase
MTAWLNGKLVTEAAISPEDRGFTLGDGLFETIRVARGTACHLDRHWRRLRAGAARLGITLDHDDAALSAAVAQLAGGDAVVRVTLTRGPAPRGLLPPDRTQPTLLITAVPLPPPLPPARLIVARTTRRNEFSPLARIKSLNYLDSILARQEAAARGADDALLLNSQSRVAEATAANLFLLIDGQALTPPVTDGALPGIRREILLERGILRERSLTLADLDRAEEMMLGNSLSLRPVIAVEGRELPLPQKLAALFGD